LRRIVSAALVAALPLFGCGPKAITAGSRPFPAEKAVFADASGTALRDLPDSGEPIRLVLIDFPWCPPCADAWESVRAALADVPPGTVRAIRILFDREVSIAASGKTEAPPLRPIPSPWPDVTTLTAIPGAFLEEFRVSQAPMLLLIDRDGKVTRRWVGCSTNLGGELSAELRKPGPPGPSSPLRR